MVALGERIRSSGIALLQQPPPPSRSRRADPANPTPVLGRTRGTTILPSAWLPRRHLRARLRRAGRGDGAQPRDLQFSCRAPARTVLFILQTSSATSNESVPGRAADGTGRSPHIEGV